MTTDTPDFSLLNSWADKLRPTTESAGRAILDVRARGFEVTKKADKSPVTEADQLAEGIVLAELEKLEPAYPIVAEEKISAGDVPQLDGVAFWLVDALDGTKEFIKNGNDFTVNIALVYKGVPIFGIVHAPARKETFVGVIDPIGDHRRAEVWRDSKPTPISVRRRPAKVAVVGSRSHEIADEMAKFLSGYNVGDRVAVGSSLKFCLVAEGLADLYPRFGPTCEWDTGAGHAVLRAAGGRVHTFNGVELPYKKQPDFLNGRFLADAGP
jgi:3'(2'), 5'-bisphosphate nucleotidase